MYRCHICGAPLDHPGTCPECGERPVYDWMDDKMLKGEKMDEHKEKFTQDEAQKMYEALCEIAEIEPRQYEVYHPKGDYMEDCEGCCEAIEIAEEALKKARGEE